MQVASSASASRAIAHFAAKTRNHFPHLRGSGSSWLCGRRHGERPADQSPLSMRDDWHGCRNGGDWGGRAKPVIHAIRMMGGESILDGHNTLRAYNALPTREEANRLRGTRPSRRPILTRILILHDMVSSSGSQPKGGKTFKGSLHSLLRQGIILIDRI